MRSTWLTYTAVQAAAVAHQLDAAAHLVGHQLPARPVVLGQPVFNRDDWVLTAPVIPESDHFFAGKLALVALLEDVFLLFLVVELARRGIECDADLLAGLVAGQLDGFENEFNGFAIGFQGRSKAAL